MEQKNWSVVRQAVGYHRYDTTAELLLLNKIWVLPSLITNYFLPQQKLISKVRDGAKVTKTYDKPLTPQLRAQAHKKVTKQDKAIMKDTLTELNPAAIQAGNPGPHQRVADPDHEQGLSQEQAPRSARLHARTHR